MTKKELIEKIEALNVDDNEPVMFHHELHGKIMPEQIWCPIRNVEYAADGVLLKG